MTLTIISARRKTSRADLTIRPPARPPIFHIWNAAADAGARLYKHGVTVAPQPVDACRDHGHPILVLLDLLRYADNHVVRLSKLVLDLRLAPG